MGRNAMEASNNQLEASMRRVLVAVLVFAFAIRAASAQGLRPTEGHWTCQSNSDATTTTVYLSAVFHATASLNDVGTAFRQWLEATYGYKGGASCGGGAP